MSPLHTVCVQCMMEAFVSGKDGADMYQAATFDETPQEHLMRVHPDARATWIRRLELTKLCANRLGERLFDPGVN